MPQMRTPLLSVLAAGICLTLSGPAVSAPADRPTVSVVYGGSTYSISSTFTNYTDGQDLLEAQPWWGNAALANALSNLVGYSAGGYSDYVNNGGILFAYAGSYGLVDLAYYSIFGPEDCVSCTGYSNAYYYAVIKELVTVESLQESLISASTGMTSVNSNINMMINGAHSRPLSRLVEPGEKTFWVTGDLGRDDHGNRSGSTALTEVGVGYNLGAAQINLSFGQTWANQDTAFEGHTRSSGQYLMLESIVPVLKDQGLYATFGVFGHRGDTDIRRGYIHLSALESSSGSPDAWTWGVRARLDWVDALELSTTGISPYVDLSYTNARINGYQESGGALPATFNARSDDYTEARIGLNTDTPLPFAEGISLVSNIEFTHRFENETAGTSGGVNGLFNFNLAGQKVQNNWVKGGIGFEGDFGPGKMALIFNATTQSAMPNLWVNTSYQMKF